MNLWNLIEQIEGNRNFNITTHHMKRLTEDLINVYKNYENERLFTKKEKKEKQNRRSKRKLQKMKS